MPCVQITNLKTTEPLGFRDCWRLNLFSFFTSMNKKVNKFFSAANSTEPEQDYDSIHRRHPDYEYILRNICSKIMKDCIKDRIDTILVSTALFLKKHTLRIIILVVLQYKTKNYPKKTVYFNDIISSFSTKTNSLYPKQTFFNFFHTFFFCFVSLFLLF